MSKHRNYTNYSKPYNKQNEPEVVNGNVTPSQGENIPAPELEEVVEETVEEIVEEVKPEEPKLIIGEVFDCVKLRLRKLPKVSAPVICEMIAGTIVKIDKAASTVEFYKVCTETGIEGYCMKKFIKVK